MDYGLNNTIISIENISGYLVDLIKECGSEYWINKFQVDQNANIHLAVMVQPYLSLVLEGTKTIESRYSINMVSPYKKVKKGDIILLKKSGGDAVAIFEAGDIRCYQLKCKKDLFLIKEEFNDRLRIDDDFWEEKSNAKYATLVDIGKLLQIPRFRINKTSRLGWVTIGPVVRNGGLDASK